MQREPLISDVPEQATSTVITPPEPLITGSGPVLWTFAGSALAIFALVFFLLLRGRASAVAKRRSQTAEYFQPAGEDAEISFDEEPDEPEEEFLEQHKHGDLTEDTEEEEDAIKLIEEPAPQEKKKKRSPFAGLFSKRDKHKPQHEAVQFEEQTEHNEGDDTTAEAQAEIRPHDGAPSEAEDNLEHQLSEQQEFEQLKRRTIEQDALAREREEQLKRDRAALEETRQQQEQQAQKHNLHAFEGPPVTSGDDHADDEIFNTLSEVEEALNVQSEAIKAETRNLLEAFASRFEARLETIANAVDKRVITQAGGSAASGDQEGEDRIAALVEMISRRLAQHRESVNTTLASLSKHVEDVAASPEDASALRQEMSMLRSALGERATTTSAPSVQLSDIVRNALPPNAYEFSAILANNRKADCLISLPNPPGPIAIDARFPSESFHVLYEARNGGEKDAENEFRRTALRHIVDIAERLIVPEQTADSALMFIPSESMYTELHANFPDIIQDSYRARVWIVSPTTLMATLHTIRAVLRDAHQRETADFIHSEAQMVLNEVDGLRQRVTTLEESFDRTRHDVRDLVTSTDQVYRRAETITNTGRSLAEESLDRGSRRIIRAPDEGSEHAGAAKHSPEHRTSAELRVENERGHEPGQSDFPLR